MFKSAKFYAIISNKSLIIKKENDDLESINDFKSFIPNVPFYYHFFDEDKPNIEDIKSEIIKLRMKNLTIILPDDAIDLEVDRRILTEFFLLRGIKKVQVKAQGFYLSLFNEKYISISRTTRTMVLQYIVNNKSIVKKYYDKNYTDVKEIALEVKNLHTGCEYENTPIYINNINNDMEKFKVIGTLVSLNDIINNIMKSETDN
ncbi:hypothetical protein [Clostridium beijerinckii]|uniref:Uncharacterized protein n=1 Tax=Clostridium beijerinckii TaxID=1520 RepID=A0A9Q5CJI9_CLOBE|nr:hypothetical protein [Clostridium beijerinckii]AQS05022.1 hypothetical protein CLBIJ_24520 [Clostridium beijerinckii]MBA2886010.1 hypothetical protein [Clostridium beijerinckii]MBA2900702.1 hypothetical protein [Clostridium beijerinckii]MBA2910569.1 hypothetical protein [Clostridium beijerinckii]MBA9015410.1 hypothetical protein [Clostridium beijerinckii]